MDTSATEKIRIFDPEKMEWERLVSDHNGKELFDKKMVIDPETGMVVNFSYYPAGYMTEWHTHQCSHGIYVIKGTLKTSAGDVPEGGFAWFPEGTAMEHGAGDEGVYVLFFTNKPFRIAYL